MQDPVLPYESDDDTLREGNPLPRITELYVEAGVISGRSFTTPSKHKEFLERAGFVDVVERKLKWPINQWAKDPHFKEIGMWVMENLHLGIEGLMMAPFTRYIGWSKEKVHVSSMEFREALKDRNTHAYVPV